MIYLNLYLFVLLAPQHIAFPGEWESLFAPVIPASL